MQKPNLWLIDRWQPYLQPKKTALYCLFSDQKEVASKQSSIHVWIKQSPTTLINLVLSSSSLPSGITLFLLLSLPLFVPIFYCCNNLLKCAYVFSSSSFSFICLFLIQIPHLYCLISFSVGKNMKYVARLYRRWREICWVGFPPI